MADEYKCELCDAGIEVIDGWHYTRVGGMVFPTNRRCAKLFPPKPKPTRAHVFLVPTLQCATCGDGMDWVPAKSRSEQPTVKTTHWKAYCKACDLTVLVPLTLRECEVVP